MSYGAGDAKPPSSIQPKRRWDNGVRTPNCSATRRSGHIGIGDAACGGPGAQSDSRRGTTGVGEGSDGAMGTVGRLGTGVGYRPRTPVLPGSTLVNSTKRLRLPTDVTALPAGIRASLGTVAAGVLDLLVHLETGRGFHCVLGVSSSGFRSGAGCCHGSR
jgi:hypothetical protein